MSGFHVAVDSLEGAVIDVDGTLPGWLADLPELPELAEMVADLRRLQKQLHTVEQFAERALAERMDGKELVWDGGRALRRRTAEKTVWDSADLSVAVLERALVDDNGEMPSGEIQTAVSKLRMLLVGDGDEHKGCANVSYWRLGELEKLGIDGKAYRTLTPGRWTVDVTVGEAAS